MKRIRRPLYSQILVWLLVNLLILGLLGFAFLSAQFRLGMDWMLSGEPGERLSALGDNVSYELSRLPEPEWDVWLNELAQAHGVTLALFSGEAQQLHGPNVPLPDAVKPKLMDRRPPQERPPRPMQRRPADAPAKPRFILRAGDPAYYWAGVQLDLISAQTKRSQTLVIRSSGLAAGGLLLDPWPWVWMLAAAVGVSVVIWLPFVHRLTRFIQRLNGVAGRIAEGRFHERLEPGSTRPDELGELSVSIHAMADQLGDYVSQQKRITADVAHELCSPIARMQMAIGVLGQRSTSDQAPYLEKLDRELQHMARLVEEVLVFSKAETLPEREKPESFELGDLLKQVIAREAAEATVNLSVPLIQLHTLRQALDRALGNILRNAVRYAPGSAIDITAEQDATYLTLAIEDRGPGVPEVALTRLFEPFYRPESARNRNTGGSGLGLAIAKRCIVACGGGIDASLRAGGGLRIRINLPS